MSSRKTTTTRLSGVLGSEGNPVRCDSPEGERAYLQRLRDAKGRAPAFRRIGCYGVGPYGNMLDGYEVQAQSGWRTVFMDMYHRAVVESRPIPGFSRSA